MAYEKTNWTSTTPVNQTNLNKIEEAIAEMYNLFYPIGTYYETSDISFNPNVTWGGTWELETDGTVLVSKSNVADSKFNTDVGTVFGEEEHQLKVDEIPNHKHWVYYKNNAGTFDIPDWSFTILNAEQVVGAKGYDISTNFVGGGLSHNNIQPSKIINRWHRTA